MNIGQQCWAKGSEVFTKATNLIAFASQVFLSLQAVKNPVVLKAFGQHVKRLRKERNLSQEKLALMADVTELTIQRIEGAKFGTSLDNLISIANALGVKLNDFFNFEY